MTTTRSSADQLAAGAVSLFGAFDIDRRPDGVTPCRLPGWNGPQLPRRTDVMVRTPCGVRLAFENRFRHDPARRADDAHGHAAPGPAAGPFGLRIDGGALHSRSSLGGNSIYLNRANPDDFPLERGPAHQIVFEALGAGPKRVSCR